MVRPNSDVSSRCGRSPIAPSTFPKPGPSEPVWTVNGVPVFISVTVESSQLPKMRPAQPWPEGDL